MQPTCAVCERWKERIKKAWKQRDFKNAQLMQRLYVAHLSDPHYLATHEPYRQEAEHVEPAI